MEKYRIILRRSSESDRYLATAPELPGCEAEGETRAEALEALEQEMAALLENIKAQGGEPPLPVDDQTFDGALSCTVSPALHRELAFAARAAKMELEAYLAELIARGGRSLSLSRGRPPQEGQGRRGGGPPGQRYHDIMENRADFIEYVRNMESGGRPGGGGRRGGRGRRGR